MREGDEGGGRKKGEGRRCYLSDENNMQAKVWSTRE